MFHAKAQQADIRIASLINDEDWFTLSEEFPLYKDSIRAGYLRLIADALLAEHTNRTAEAITMLGELLTKHQEEIGTQSALNFALLRLQLIGEQGRYAEAADGIQRIIEQLESAGMTETQSLHTMYAHYNILREYAPLTILRPEHDVNVPFRLIEPKVSKQEEWMRGGKKSNVVKHRPDQAIRPRRIDRNLERRRRRSGADREDGLRPLALFHLRHHEIHEDDIGLRLGGEADGRLAVARLADDGDISFRLE